MKGCVRTFNEAYIWMAKKYQEVMKYKINKQWSFKRENKYNTTI